MFNEVLIVGKIDSLPQKIEKRRGMDYFKVVVEVKQLFKNSEGHFESDFIPVVLWYGVAQTVLDVSKIGDMISIKGHLTTVKTSKSIAMEVEAEKVDFLQKYL